MKDKQEWLVLEGDHDWKIILPSFDIRAHSNDSDEVLKAYNGKDGVEAELASEDCPCKPKIDEENRLIIHNSFIDQQRVRDSIKNNFE